MASERLFMNTVRVAVLSDDRLFCEGLLRIIGADGSLAAVGHDEKAALGPALRAARPHVLLVDSRMEGALGLCVALRREAGPAIVLVAADDGDDWGMGALVAGARGILAKSARPEDLVKAVRVVHEGQIWARRHLMAEWMARISEAPTRPSGESMVGGLSERESEIFRNAAAGLSNKELADRLAISEATVKAHLTRIFQKLGLRGRAELAAAYHGITPPARSPTGRRKLRPPI
jgi:DNA-binding NarL/FixJ family response regulator